LLCAVTALPLTFFDMAISLPGVILTEPVIE